MDLTKITRPQVLIIGGVLTLIVIIGVYFGLMKPRMDRLADATRRREDAEARSSKKGEYQKLLATNKKKVAQAQADWAVYDRQLMPQGNRAIDVSDLIDAMQKRWYEQVKFLGPHTEAFVKKDTTVRTFPAISVPAPPSDPNQVAGKVIELPLGTVTAEGTFQNLLKHAERWNTFDRLVLIDGLNLTGNSPHLQTAYTMTCYIFTHGDKPGPSIPVAAAGTGGFGGGRGGGFGGYPGAGGGGAPPPVFAPPAGAGGGGANQGD